MTTESLTPDLEMPVSIDVLRHGKAYTAPQAARLARTTATTVRNWLRGYEGQGRRMEPVFGAAKAGQDGELLLVSFVELVEIIVVASYRRRMHGHKPTTLERLRTAHRFARRQWTDIDYPFASLNFERMGPHMMYTFQEQDPGEGVLALDLDGQYAFPFVVQEAIAKFEFEADYAVRYFPAGRGVPIVVDPRIGAGRPVVNGTSVSVEMVRRRWKAEQSIREIAEDFEIPPEEIEAVLRYAAA